MPHVCVFDVNETLLDLSALDSHFEAVFGDRAVRKAWFQQLLQSAMVTIITNRYIDFGTIGRTALDMTAKRHSIRLSDEDRAHPQLLSADEVRRLKPAAEAYRYAAEPLGVDISQIRLITAHARDVAGAQQAGSAAAFVAQSDQVLDPLFERPDIVGRDLHEVTARIIQQEAHSR